MKKIINALICLLMLTGCSSPKTTWSDIQDKIIEIEDDVKNTVNGLPTILKEDYQKILNELADNLSNLSLDKNIDKEGAIKNIYKTASYIESLASLFNGGASNELIKLSRNIKKLCEYAYDGNTQDFENMKVDILKDIENINSWANDKWASIEKKDIIDWSDVEQDYQTIEEEIKEKISPKKITEIELDELKHNIIDYYDEISTGITKENEEYAKKIYAAAYELSMYAEKLANKEAQKVNDFANATIDFVKSNYKNSDIEEVIEYSDYKQYVEDASKWTQSLWNEITKYLRIN